MHTVMVQDGPYAGTEHAGRASKGVLFVDKAAGMVAVYNLGPDGLVLQHVATRDPALEERAVADSEREVRSAPW